MIIAFILIFIHFPFSKLSETSLSS
jgi:hypothetical protein